MQPIYGWDAGHSLLNDVFKNVIQVLSELVSSVGGEIFDLRWNEAPYPAAALVCRQTV